MKTPPYPHPVIAREGWLIIAASLLLSVLLSWFAPWLSLPFWLFTIFSLQFFRDPPRQAPEGIGLVLSPADGRIVSVEDAVDPYAGGRPAVKISVFMNVFNVHSNRAPADGKVLGIKYYPGKFLNADLDKASLENERNAMVMQTSSGQIITAVQVAGLVARRILCHVAAGQSLYAGQRYGFIRFGSRVDIYLPPGAQPRVSLGDKVSATSTVLAELPQNLPRPEHDFRLSF